MSVVTLIGTFLAGGALGFALAIVLIAAGERSAKYDKGIELP